MQIPFLLHLCFHMYPNISQYQQTERTYLIRLRWGAVCFQFSTSGPLFLDSSSKIWFAHRTVLINVTDLPCTVLQPLTVTTLWMCAFPGHRKKPELEKQTSLCDVHHDLSEWWKRVSWKNITCSPSKVKTNPWPENNLLQKTPACMKVTNLLVSI